MKKQSNPSHSIGMDKEKKRIIKLIRSFPLQSPVFFDEEAWNSGYLALDEVADYLGKEDIDNAIKKKLKKKPHECCDGECHHDACCGKVEANCPNNSL